MKQRQITLRAPLGGVDRRLGFQSQPQFTTPASSNVLGDDTILGRARAGARPGLSKALTTDFGSPFQFLGAVNVNVGDGQTRYRRMVIAAVDGQLKWAHEDDTVAPWPAWNEVAGGPHVNPDVQLEWAAREQKVYIADYANVNHTDGAVSSGVLSSATVGNWSTVGILSANLSQWRVKVSGTTYSLSAVSGANLTIAGTPPGDGTGLTFSLHRTPKVWNLANHTVATWTTDTYGANEVGVENDPKGSVPQDCRLITEYQDRLVLAGNVYNPHVWFASRSGDPNDFDYGISDQTSAVAYSNYAGGQLGEPITCLIPHGFDCLLIGCEDSMHVMRGNPANTSSHLFKVDDKVGIIGPRSYCKTPHDETVVMTRDGLYYMPSGCGVAPTSISREKIPLELLGLKADDYNVCMMFDLRLRCIQIWAIPTDNSQTECWFFNWEHKAFWPVLMQADHQPWCVYDFEPLGTAAKSSVLLGCYDGVCRQFNRDAVDDDGTDFASYLRIGPFMLASNIDNKGTIQRMRIAKATDSGAVSWKLAADVTAEAVNDQLDDGNEFQTGTVNAFAVHPRCTGSAGMLELYADGSATQWAFEEAVVQYKEAGRMR